MHDAISIRDRILLALFILTAKKFTKGDLNLDFERKWSSWQETKYSVFVNSGSSANLLMIAAIKELYKLKDGDKVLVPAITWVTNISPIIQLGLQPIFCDINLQDFSFDYKELEKIKKLHPDIKCIFVTHLLGLPSNIPAIRNVFPDTIMLEDCCESHGGTIDNTKVGNFGECSSFSFYFGHHMTTVEGGMISTDNPELYKLLLLKRSHGLARELPYDDFVEQSKKYPELDSKFLFLTDGFNVRSTEINAFLGIEQLKRLNENIKKRRINFDYFIRNFLNYYQDIFYIPKQRGNTSFCLPLIFKDKSLFLKTKLELGKYKIEYRPVVSGNLLLQPFLSKYKNQEDFKNANIVHEQGIYVGNSQFVNYKHIDFLTNIFHMVLST